jgi:hypothetical protein
MLLDLVHIRLRQAGPIRYAAAGSLFRELDCGGIFSVFA